MLSASFHIKNTVKGELKLVTKIEAGTRAPASAPAESESVIDATVPEDDSGGPSLAGLMEYLG